MHRTAGRGHVRAETLVVFHVTAGQVFRGSVVKFCKQIGGYFAQRVDQHIQPATVGHADDDLLYAQCATALDQLVHAGDKAFTTFERKALLADVFGVQKALKALSSAQAVEDVQLFFFAERWLAANRFQLLLPPALLVLVGGVHVLGTNRAAIGFA